MIIISNLQIFNTSITSKNNNDNTKGVLLYLHHRIIKNDI